jgi:hypothetical protein
MKKDLSVSFIYEEPHRIASRDVLWTRNVKGLRFLRFVFRFVINRGGLRLSVFRPQKHKQEMPEPAL